MPVGLPPIDNDLPPYVLPVCLLTCAATPANEPGWSDYIDFTDHPAFIEIARRHDTLHFDFSADVTLSGENYTGTSDADSDPPPPILIFGNLHLGGAPAGGGARIVFGGTAVFMLLADLQNDVYKLKPIATGTVFSVITNRISAPPPPVTHVGVDFKFDAASVAAATGDDKVGSFSMLGVTVPFVAHATTMGAVVTAASVASSVL